MGIVGIAWRAPEALVVGGDELRQERVAGLHGRDAPQPELLHQPVLQRLVHPLDAPLGLRGVGADDLDVELGERAAELRHATGSASRVLSSHPEDGVLVAVEGRRAPVPRQVGARRGEVVEGRLRTDEPQLHEVTGGVVHEDEQGAAGAAALEPLMVAAVYLDQLAQARSPVARLVGMPPALAAREPDPGRRHPLAQGLAADGQVVALEELLARQRRPEVRVALPDDGDDARLELCREPPVARPTSVPGYQAGGAGPLQGPAQPPDLPEVRPSCSAAFTWASRRSTTRRMTSSRSSSLALMVISPAIRPPPGRQGVASSGHFYLAGTGHFHVGATESVSRRDTIRPRRRVE